MMRCFLSTKENRNPPPNQKSQNKNSNPTSPFIYFILDYIASLGISILWHAPIWLLIALPTPFTALLVFIIYAFIYFTVYQKWNCRHVRFRGEWIWLSDTWKFVEVVFGMSHFMGFWGGMAAFLFMQMYEWVLPFCVLYCVLVMLASYFLLMNVEMLSAMYLYHKYGPHEYDRIVLGKEDAGLPQDVSSLYSITGSQFDDLDISIGSDGIKGYSPAHVYSDDEDPAPQSLDAITDDDLSLDGELTPRKLGKDPVMKQKRGSSSFWNRV